MCRRRSTGPCVYERPPRACRYPITRSCSSSALPSIRRWPICSRELAPGREVRVQRRSWRPRDPRAIAPDVLVVDTSALLEALVAREPAPRLVERLSDDGDLHAPHLVDIEVLNSLRRLNAVG